MGCCLKCGKRDLPKHKSNGLRYCSYDGYASDGGKFDTSGRPISARTRAAVYDRQQAIAAHIETSRLRDVPVSLPRRSWWSRIFPPARQISRSPEDRRPPPESLFGLVGDLFLQALKVAQCLIRLWPRRLSQHRPRGPLITSSNAIPRS